MPHSGYWQLLPAVNRYLEHFETLMSLNDDTLEQLTAKGNDQSEDEEEYV